MTKAGIKTEDYREINDYWCRRLLRIKREIEHLSWVELIDELNDGISVEYKMKSVDGTFKQFTTTTLTLGYPSKTDAGRFIHFEHAGIEIRTGNPEWGAEPNKLYFVIKHGKRLNK